MNNSHKRNEKCITEVIQKGQSMVHSSSEVKDTTFSNSLIIHKENSKEINV